ncbi:GntR family transcriptional regulator [Mycobacteroides saopaulense]|uniref:FadR/GntR family transcriptional regulator n=1 Tax=Mycobacteroides saopaulense TaxID=1578165 RepID=UPI00072020B8|nr:FadR/GntR family transcriptional regulator [Mycobacteroides saopaulense]ALR11698.1 GntR family transcriptional regulator [Mycobacteroides saopaulense]
MQPVRRQTLIGQVTEQLREEILSGRWAIGARIPTEPELCELTGTSRNTIREAVQALVHAGMLERRQGSGTYVLSLGGGGSAIADYFAAANDRDLIELRQTLEVTAAGLAAQRRDEDDIEQLRALLRRRNELWAPLHVAPQHVEDAISTDIAVHRAVVAASHNALYLELYDSLLGLMDHYMRGNPIGAECSFEHEHTKLVEGVIAGDIEAAEAATEQLFAELSLRRKLPGRNFSHLPHD